jgi:hypothetical protein
MLLPSHWPSFPELRKLIFHLGEKPSVTALQMVCFSRFVIPDILIFSKLA